MFSLTQDTPIQYITKRVSYFDREVLTASNVAHHFLDVISERPDSFDDCYDLLPTAIRDELALIAAKSDAEYYASQFSILSDPVETPSIVLNPLTILRAKSLYSSATDLTLPRLTWLTNPILFVAPWKCCVVFSNNKPTRQVYRRTTWFLRMGLRHTFFVWRRGLALVESVVVQASPASFRAVL